MNRAERVAPVATIPTERGDLIAHGYRDPATGIEHVAFVAGEPHLAENPAVRLHSECLTGDLFGSLRCDCGSQLERALDTLAEEGCGVIIYLRGHEGRGIGIVDKLRAYALQEQGADTVDANLALGLEVDARDYQIAADILHDLGVNNIRLLTNNPAKFEGLAQHGINVAMRVPHPGEAGEHNTHYLETKRDRLGHAEAVHAPDSAGH